ncbi:hypothetical protein N7481_005137 [Penicillium waksmanii]|uniref:uncharacterized protein n=1 Tax=Penicillium waksmanii TaxID=69791 RepID=UPI00254954D2|nr:uncharacterized protein N7481_005137 [Penicillium waksmanii]KAJ5983038.1 hypothetical protein N7481_005137 [Penicillium waksmanii]
MTTKTEAATYTHGHHASVIRSHSARTAKNSVSFLLPHLKPSMKILDIGCGPGSITVDLAEYVPQGHVTGLERAGTILTQARELASARGVTNIEFVEGDGNGLQFDDGSFDVVLCHQVLQHVADPVGVLQEMNRVTKSGGIIAAREADYGVFAWYPELPGLREWQGLYDQIARFNGGEPNAGRFLHVWGRKAGLDDLAGEGVEEQFFIDSLGGRPGDWGGSGEGFEVLERVGGEDQDAWLSIPSAEILSFKK